MSLFDGDGPSEDAIKQRRYRLKHPLTEDQRLAAKARDKKHRAGKPPPGIAILDMETDPFDNVSRSEVFPFLAILYGEGFEPVILWCEEWRQLMRQVRLAIEALPGRYIIYAHNGGRFDYMYLLHEIRGSVSFKGRGIMRANIGPHQLRDSFHIIPESLKNANRKDDFDYTLNLKQNREAHRAAIIQYCLNDCQYTYEIVKAFIARFGTKMSVGQAAMAELKKHYVFEKLSERVDRFLRPYFFGGRTECIRSGVTVGRYYLYDVHSMYPDRMANCRHPIGRDFFVGNRITEKTAFITLRCINHGAFVARNDAGDLSTDIADGIFETTIHEYKMALRFGLIDKVKIIRTIDFDLWTDFSKHVIPIYDERMRLKQLKSSDPEVVREILFLKLLLNTGYGKFAQNPRNFKDYYLTAPMERPPVEWQFLGVEDEVRYASIDNKRKRRDDPDYREDPPDVDTIKNRREYPEIETDHYWIWSHRVPDIRFNHVGTAASITGAARAKLMEGLHYAIDPLYCDTDSIVCRGFRDGVYIHASELGAWNQEAEISTFIGHGKKLYGYRRVDFDPRKSGSEYTVRAKGMNSVTWQDLLNLVGKPRDFVIPKTMKAPTLTKSQEQKYLTRNLARTSL